MFRGRAAGAGLEQAAAVEQGHDREHPRAGAQLEDGEQVGQVVTQHVAGHRDGVLAAADALQRELHGLDGRHDADVEVGEIVLVQVDADLRDDLGVVAAVLVEPEDGRRAGGAGAHDGQLDPVADGLVLGLAHAEDVAGRDGLLEHHGARGVDHADGTGARSGEGLVVGAVLLGFLGHQAHVRHAAHGRGIELAVLLAVLDHRLVHRRVAAVGNHGDGVLQLVGLVPHAPAVAHDVGHRGVDDHVVGHVQVGDALARVDHGQGRAALVAGGDVGLDLGLFGRGQLVELLEHAGETVVHVGADLREHVGVLVQGGCEVHRHAVAEHDGVGDLHHRGLEVQREQGAVLLGGGDLLGVEGAQGLHAHHRGVDDLVFEQGHLLLQHRHGAVGGRELDAHVRRGAQGRRGLAAVKVAAGHVGHAGLGAGLGPGLHHAVGVLLGEGLDRGRGAAVGVALAQHGVHGRAEHLGEAGLQGFFRLGFGLLGVVGHVVAPALELLDRFLQLGDRGADVGQLDDVAVRRLGHLAQAGQLVGDPLLGGEVLREIRQDAAGQGDVTRLDLDACPLRVGLHDRQQGVGRQGRRLVDLRPDDLGG